MAARRLFVAPSMSVNLESLMALLDGLLVWKNPEVIGGTEDD